MSPFAAALSTHPDARKRLRELYRAARAVPTTRFALVAVLVPALLTLALVPTDCCSTQRIILALYLGLSAVTDLLWRRIPDRLTVAALAWAAAAHASALAGVGAVLLPTARDWLCRETLYFVVTLGLHLLARGGVGDVKLLLCVALLIGPFYGFEALVLGYLTAAAAAVVLLIGRWLGASHPAFHARRLPLAPAFALGVLFTLMLPGAPA